MEIKPYVKNAKKHPDKQIKQIAASILRFGFRQALVVDKKGELIVGHGRYFAATLVLGWVEFREAPEAKKGETFIPYQVADDLTPEEIMAYRLADNKLNESAWDMNLAIEDLKLIGSELVELTGFSQDLLVDTTDQDDIVPVVKIAHSQIGDLYEVESAAGVMHRILCGDSADPAQVEKLMGKQRADMVFTDPPYNVNYKGQGKETSNKILMDNVSDDQFLGFLRMVFKNYATYAKEGAGNYVFHASVTQAVFEQAMKENGFEIKNQLIWNKPVAALGWGDYQWKHEPFFYAGRKGASTVFYGDRKNKTVWDFHQDEEQLIKFIKREKLAETQGKTTIWTMKRDNVQGYVHPTQKPVELICHALANSSKRGDIVMDLFGGSGSTLIASHKSARVCYTMEMDPIYVDTIVKRYLDYTETTEVIKNGKKTTWENIILNKE